MSGRTDWKKIVFVVWAVVLAFMLSHQLAVASSSHNACARLCKKSCSGNGGCGVSLQIGCQCGFVCDDGTEGGSVCVE